MKEYNFTQVTIWGSYINSLEVHNHLNCISEKGWELVSTQMIAPTQSDSTPSYNISPGSFNFFWERTVVKEVEPMPMPKSDPKFDYWKKIQRGNHD